MSQWLKRLPAWAAPLIGAGGIGVCPLCWAGSASLLTYLGLGALIPVWRWVAFALIGLGVIGFVLDYRSHRHLYPLGLLVTGGALLYLGRYVVGGPGFGGWPIWGLGAILVIVAVILNRRLFSRRRGVMNTMSKKAIALVSAGIMLALLVVGAAFLTSSSRGKLSVATVQNVPYDVRVETRPRAVRAGRVAAVRVHVSRAGRPVDVDAAGRLLHVVMVSANLRDTYHTYSPISEGNGVYRVDHVFTEPGPYRIWTELDDTAAPQRHDRQAEQIAYATVTVRGTGSGETALVASSETTVDGYRLTLITPPLQAGAPATLRIEARDAAGSRVPLTEHEPFLYFISGENFSFFRHGHGFTLPDGSAGLDNTFPIPGRYVFWMEVHLVAGETVRVVEVPFLVAVQ